MPAYNYTVIGKRRLLVIVKTIFHILRQRITERDHQEFVLLFKRLIFNREYGYLYCIYTLLNLKPRLLSKLCRCKKIFFFCKKWEMFLSRKTQ